MAGDISAYIPTNVISITDGQIFLETDLFFSGQRPAINTGLSVSRVGGAAQIKAMKKVAGKLKLELAQYREMAAFAQFGSELDKDTKERLHQGERMMEILKQPQYSPMKVEQQVVILYTVINRFLSDVPVEKISEFEKDFIIFMENNHPEILTSIRETKDLTDDNEKALKAAIEEFRESYLQ